MPTVLHVDDKIVKETVEAAAAAACNVLDELFPGSDSGGISSDFHGLLTRQIMEMIQGRTPRPTREIHLQKLVMNGDDFGPQLDDRDMMCMPIRVGHVSWGIVNGRYQRIGVDILGLDPLSDHFGYRDLVVGDHI